MDKTKLLVVDDEEAIRTQMKWALAGDYEVTLAENRPMALERARLEKPPPVLSRLGAAAVPEDRRGGVAVPEEGAAARSGFERIVVTGNQAKENALKAIEHGAFDYS